MWAMPLVPDLLSCRPVQKELKANRSQVADMLKSG